MADRYTEASHPLRSSNEQQVVLSAKWAIGSTGAVGVRTGSKSLSLTRTGAGAYTIQVCTPAGTARAPLSVVHATVTPWVDDTDPSDDTDGHFPKHKLISDADGTMTVQFVDEAGAVRELPSGAVVTCLVFAANADV